MPTKKIDLSELFGNPIKQDDRIYTRPVANIHEFYLSGEVEGPENYIEWIQTIRHATSMDVIKIYINSPGGRIDSTIQLLRALSETDATVITSVEGMCASAATMIFLQADNFEVSEYSSFLFHTYSGGILGKGNEIHSQSLFERKWSTNMMRKIYDGFLTQEEINRVIDGVDIWMDSSEVIKRLKKRAEKQQGPKVEKAEKARSSIKVLDNQE
jgi:ATP-dependent Clp protease, protease subunit